MKDEARTSNAQDPGPKAQGPTPLFSYCDSPFGELLLTSDGTALTGLYLPDGRHALSAAPDWRREDGLPVFSAVREQLGEYFRGARAGFELPLAARGTPFQQRVWEELARIPYGTTISYA